MRVLVAGASGVLGRQLVPRLAASGHHVIGMARRPRASLFTTPNVEMVSADALNRAALTTSCTWRRRTQLSTCSPQSQLGLIHGGWPSSSGSPTSSALREPGICWRPPPRAECSLF